jgi:hypothetical protein
MARIAKVYRTLWGLSGNPFPDHAIAAAGDAHQPFYEQLHPGVGAKMARAFLGSDCAGPRVAFLWSLGHGEEARGYGKTRHLLWFADRVNEDLGMQMSKLAGRDPDSEKVLAAYAAFSTVEGVSLSNLLFDVALQLARSLGARLVDLRAAALARGRTADELYERAKHRLMKSEESWDYWLLRSLVDREPQVWIEYLESFGQWHKVRYGREMLRSVVAFLKELGIDRLVVLVDQVEDFASYNTPTYKLQRDFHRLAVLCSSDRLLRNRITFVLTMHPRAGYILSRYWSGPVSPDESAENVIVLGAMTKIRFASLVTAYLDSVRIEHSGQQPLAPFTEETINFIHEHERGRPGYCLQRLFYLMDLAAAGGMKHIERDFAERCLTEGHAS